MSLPQDRIVPPKDASRSTPGGAWRTAPASLLLVLVSALAIACGGATGPGPASESQPEQAATVHGRPDDGGRVEVAEPAEPAWRGCASPPPATVSREALRAFLARGLPDLLGRVRTAPVLDREGPGARFVGFRVVQIDPALRCGVFGLREGDVVTAVDGRSIERPEEALAIWEALGEATSITLSVLRGSTMVEETVTVVDEPVRIDNGGVTRGGSR